MYGGGAPGARDDGRASRLELHEKLKLERIEGGTGTEFGGDEKGRAGVSKNRRLSTYNRATNLELVTQVRTVRRVSSPH